MVGAPGAGKGTQAHLLSERLGLPHVASGDLFREAMRDESPLGDELRSYIDRGALVPDDVAIKVVAQRLSRPDAAEGAILDGFPRTRHQAEVLDRALAQGGGSVDAALFIGVRPEELLRRLSGRWVCEAEGHVFHITDNPPERPGLCDIDGSPLYQRSDDEPDTVSARLEQQLPSMYEVIDHYRDQGVLSAVDGEGPIEQVAESLYGAIRPTSAATTGSAGAAAPERAPRATDGAPAPHRR